MHAAIQWIYKLAVCLILAVLAFFYLDDFSRWLDNRGWAGLFLGLFAMFLMLGIGLAFSKLDVKLGFPENRILGIIGGIAGLAQVGKAIYDFIGGAYSGGFVGIFYIVVIHLVFALVLFGIGFGADAAEGRGNEYRTDTDEGIQK